MIGSDLSSPLKQALGIENESEIRLGGLLPILDKFCR
jgi:hypothetical protein